MSSNLWFHPITGKLVHASDLEDDDGKSLGDLQRADKAARKKAKNDKAKARKKEVRRGKA